MKYITRRKRTYGCKPGWVVRLTREGDTHSKLFSDKDSGGKQKALAKATRYRNKLLSNSPPVDRVRRGSNAGITLRVEGTYRAWTAHWVDQKGRRKSKSFRISEFGTRKAKRLAQEAREEGIAGR